jgi:hypothetical protein
MTVSAFDSHVPAHGHEPRDRFGRRKALKIFSVFGLSPAGCPFGHDTERTSEAPTRLSAAFLAFLVLLGVVVAKAGGAGMMMAAIRVAFWTALAIAVTVGVAASFGAHV